MICPRHTILGKSDPNIPFRWDCHQFLNKYCSQLRTWCDEWLDNDFPIIKLSSLKLEQNYSQFFKLIEMKLLAVVPPTTPFSLRFLEFLSRQKRNIGAASKNMSACKKEMRRKRCKWIPFSVCSASSLPLLPYCKVFLISVQFYLKMSVCSQSDRQWDFN